MAEEKISILRKKEHNILDTTNIGDLYFLYVDELLGGDNMEELLFSKTKHIINDKHEYYISFFTSCKSKEDFSDFCNKYVNVKGKRYKHLWIYRGNLAHTFVCQADNIILKIETKRKDKDIPKEYFIQSVRQELEKNILFSKFALPVPDVLTKELIVIDDRHMKATTYSGCSLPLLSYNEELFEDVVNNIDKLFNIINLFSRNKIFMPDFNPHNVLYNTETGKFILIDFEAVSLKNEMTVREVYDNYIKQLLTWNCLKGKDIDIENSFARGISKSKKTKGKSKKAKGKKAKGKTAKGKTAKGKKAKGKTAKGKKTKAKTAKGKKTKAKTAKGKTGKDKKARIKKTSSKK